MQLMVNILLEGIMDVYAFRKGYSCYCYNILSDAIDVINDLS